MASRASSSRSTRSSRGSLKRCSYKAPSSSMATAKSSTRRQVTWPGWTWTAKPLTVAATRGVSSGRPRPRLAGTRDRRFSARRRVSVTTYSSRELPHIRGELLRLLQREKVAAALEFRPMHHVVVALGKAADGDVLRLRYQDARGHAAAGLGRPGGRVVQRLVVAVGGGSGGAGEPVETDRKSTRLNSSHVSISYAVFC